jgi:hypothetical protein
MRFLTYDQLAAGDLAGGRRFGASAVDDARRGVRGSWPEVEAVEATIGKWQAEAHKLEQQGRLEQAEAIRATVLKVAPIPWTVCFPKQAVPLRPAIRCDVE